jgi:hypothetical protein
VRLTRRVRPRTHVAVRTLFLFQIFRPSHTRYIAQLRPQVNKPPRIDDAPCIFVAVISHQLLRWAPSHRIIVPSGSGFFQGGRIQEEDAISTSFICGSSAVTASLRVHMLQHYRRFRNRTRQLIYIYSPLTTHSLTHDGKRPSGFAVGLIASRLGQCQIQFLHKKRVRDPVSELQVRLNACLVRLGIGTSNQRKKMDLPD